MWIRNTDCKKDAVLTMTVVIFLVVVFKVLLSGVNINIGGSSFSFGDINASVIAALFTPTLGAYVARRYTDKKY